MTPVHLRILPYCCRSLSRIRSNKILLWSVNFTEVLSWAGTQTSENSRSTLQALDRWACRSVIIISQQSVLNVWNFIDLWSSKAVKIRLNTFLHVGNKKLYVNNCRLHALYRPALHLMVGNVLIQHHGERRENVPKEKINFDKILPTVKSRNEQLCKLIILVNKKCQIN